MEETINNESIINFINACNDFIDGKFILADIKISKILKTISQSDEIYNLIKERMINYNFDTEFEKAIVENEQGVERFELPSDKDQIIPLVFCLLVEFDSKRISLNEFIKAQYPLANNQNEEYSAFAKEVVAPFRDVIAEIFGVEVVAKKQTKIEPVSNIIDEKIKELNSQKETQEVVFEEYDDEADANSLMEEYNTTIINAVPVEAIIEAHKQMQEDEDVDLLFDRILRLTRIIENKLIFVRNPLKRSDLELIVEALVEACEIKNAKIIVALVMGLSNFARNDRHLKQEIRELLTICYNLYE